MIVVLEGADFTGKTTLAKELERLGFRYVHNGPPKSEDMFEEYTRQLESIKPGEDVVFDRLHLGELVYGPVMRNGSWLTWPQARLLNRLLFAKGGILVYCSAPPGDIINGWVRRRLSEYVDEEQKIHRVIKNYTDLWLRELRESPSVRRYHRQEWEGRANNFAESLVYYRVRRDLTAMGATGEPKARFLVVGEAPGGERDLAFYSDRNSSGFLNERLWEAGYKEKELLFINARDKRGRTRDLRPIYQAMMPVIALGKVAQATCRAQNIPFMAAPHPQYVKRFKKGQYEKYTELLRSFKET